ncbi:hypothetical protein DCAR_0311830 [Daucus carota subsp. sativus]|uniref:PAR1 protein n=1 Tax=Daucus carota subsp. sativus TaxID=79200 RepID=A0A162AJ60_DAUCS|nr:PREDICTED: mucin-1-like [Daucus carota subsp. sativus]WOG92558.1 hypothetical protein DCAR_0311830 [Daucus carota subsp. sativus]
MSSSNKLPLILFLASLLLRTTLGEIICEELSKEVCAFSVSSSGKRCLLENSETKEGLDYQCTTSDVIVQRMAEHIETDACVNTCGLDRTMVGMSSDSLLEPQFTAKLCSDYCYHNCPNIIDLYFNLAAGEGVFLPDLCAEQKVNPHRAMQVLMNYVHIRAVGSNYDTEEDAPSPSSQSNGTPAPAPAPAPAPSVESAENEDGAPAPSSESAESEDDAPAPSSESEDDAPAPSSESAESEDDAPAPSSESEDDAPAPSSEDDALAPAPSSETAENEDDSPSPWSQSAKTDDYVPSLLSGEYRDVAYAPPPSSESAEGEEGAPSPSPSASTSMDEVEEDAAAPIYH